MAKESDNKNLNTDNFAGTEKIIETIKHEAEGEAEKLLSEAREYSKKRREQAEAEAQKLRNTAENMAKEEARRIIENALTEVRIEIEQKKLILRKKIYDSVIEKTRKILQNSITSDEYKNAVLNWILEGVMILNSENIIVSCSEAEKKLFDGKFINDLKAMVKNKAGRDVGIRINTDSQLNKQGVIIELPDGRLSYNNTIESRMNRLGEKIKDIIYKTIFMDLE